MAKAKAPKKGKAAAKKGKKGVSQEDLKRVSGGKAQPGAKPEA